jgi:hypothetical protein
VLAREGNERARALLWRLEPYVHALPVPSSALVNAARQLAERGGTMRNVSVTSMEPPSAVLSLEDTVRRAGEESVPTVSFQEIPDPDPRVARAAVKHVLWAYEGTRARPALGAPDDVVAKAIAELASSPYGVEPWWGSAQTLGARLGPPAVESLLAVMVHPPPRPASVPPWDWRFGVQVAAALCLASVDGGWEGSARREGLLSLLQGPVDWTAAAAVIALAEIARREEAPRSAIVGLLADEVLVPMSPIRFECIIEPAVPLLLGRVPLSARMEETLAAFARREGI